MMESENCQEFVETCLDDWNGADTKCSILENEKKLGESTNHTDIKCSFKKQKQLTTFRCHICEKCFTSNCVLKDHIFEDHFSKVCWEDSDLKLYAANESSEKFANCSTCNFCGKQFINGQMKVLHIASEHFGIEENQTNIIKKSLNENKNENEVNGPGNPKSCLIPKAEIHNSQKNLTDQQKRIHVAKKIEKFRAMSNGNRPYICDKCGKSFLIHGHLRLHYKSHVQVEIHQCKFCDKVYKQRWHLKTHLGTHTLEKPHSCEVCDKSYTTLSNLRRHQRSHIDEKPLRCSYCEKIFRAYPSLQIHERSHTGEKPFKCKYCDTWFSSPANLANHSRVHVGEEGHKCDVCDERFLFKCNKIQHMRVHNEREKPYKCEHCEKSFLTPRTLDLHLKNHSL